jgi:glucose dehydrogenase
VRTLRRERGTGGEDPAKREGHGVRTSTRSHAEAERLRAFDVESCRELWSVELPAGGKATPMTYAIEGRQFVVIAAGGGGRFGIGDYIVAFALPDR